MIRRLWRAWQKRRETRARAGLDALKVRYHTFRILLANNERARDRLAGVEAALAGDTTADALTGLVEELQAVTFELVDGASRLAGDGASALYIRQLRLEEALRTALEAVEDAGRPPSCRPLSEALAAGEVGGKAAGVSLLLRNGFPVPAGFAVTARACREFLREAGLDDRIRQALDTAVKTDAALAAACEAIRRDILAAPLPEWLREDLRAAVAGLTETGGSSEAIGLAVRSSALTEDRSEHSFAGQFATVLNVSPSALEQGFSAVMAGAFTERAVSYRRDVGLPPAALDMAVLVQVMVPAVAAGVVFTVDPVRPETGRMLISAVPGLGILAVNGAVPVDIYRVDRDDPSDIVAQLARKTKRAVSAPTGGIRREAIPRDEQKRPVFGPAVLERLTRLALAAEALAGSCRDLEYAVDDQGRIWLLQSRPARIVWGGRRPAPALRELYRGGMTASPGRCLGRTRHMTGEAAFAAPVTGPVIAVLPQARPEAASGLFHWQGVVVAGDTPDDPLSVAAQEMGRPMLVRATGAMEAIPDGRPVILDASETVVLPAPAAIGDLDELLAPVRTMPGKKGPATVSPARARVRELIVPLTFPEASAVTVSAADCRTLHDIIRFVHDAAVPAHFDADQLPGDTSPQVRILRGDSPLEVLVIDLGGGLREEAPERHISSRDVTAVPLAALWQGLSTPVPAPEPSPAAAPPDAQSASQTAGRGRRSAGRPNYVLAARDYVHVNARFQSYSLLLDAVCGPRARGNYVRLRLRDSSEATPLRERRLCCLAAVLQKGGLLVTRREDLLLAGLTDATAETTAKALVLLGRLLGYTPRLDDAAMADADAPHRASI